MNFHFYHNNINVLDLEKSIEFYKKALGLTITRAVSYTHLDVYKRQATSTSVTAF